MIVFRLLIVRLSHSHSQSLYKLQLLIVRLFRIRRSIMSIAYSKVLAVWCNRCVNKLLVNYVMSCWEYNYKIFYEFITIYTLSQPNMVGKVQWLFLYQFRWIFWTMTEYEATKLDWKNTKRSIYIHIMWAFNNFNFNGFISFIYPNCFSW